MANIKPMQEVECTLGDMGRGYQKMGGGLAKKRWWVISFFLGGGGGKLDELRKKFSDTVAVGPDTL